MVLLMLVMIVAVTAGPRAAVATSDVKIETLEKQVEILTDLVHAQSNVMSKFSCEGSSSSGSASDCILKVSNQAKEIHRLDAEVKALQVLTKAQGNDIQQLQSTVSDLSKKLTSQETKLTSLDNKYASEITKRKQEILHVDKKTNTVANNVNRLKTQIQQLSGQWPSGSYCILASGGCPAGFTRHSGYMKAISLYAGNGNYINQGTFGDSKIKCHGSCGQYGHWTGELYINACCK